LTIAAGGRRFIYYIIIIQYYIRIAISAGRSLFPPYNIHHVLQRLIDRFDIKYFDIAKKKLINTLRNNNAIIVVRVSSPAAVVSKIMFSESFSSGYALHDNNIIILHCTYYVSYARALARTYIYIYIIYNN